MVARTKFIKQLTSKICQKCKHASMIKNRTANIRLPSTQTQLRDTMKRTSQGCLKRNHSKPYASPRTTTLRTRISTRTLTRPRRVSFESSCSSRSIGQKRSSKLGENAAWVCRSRRDLDTCKESFGYWSACASTS